MKPPRIPDQLRIWRWPWLSILFGVAILAFLLAAASDAVTAIRVQHAISADRYCNGGTDCVVRVRGLLDQRDSGLRRNDTTPTWFLRGATFYDSFDVSHAVSDDLEAYVEVHCKGTISPDELRAAFSRVPEVHAAATVSGAADAILHIVAKDVRDLERALERVRVETDNIDHTETAIVLSRLIERYGPGQSEFSPPM